MALLVPNITYNGGTNDLTGAANRARVGGSGFTVFTWNEKPIAFCRQIAHKSAGPVGPGVTPIHPLDSPYPVELVTPQALTMGELSLELYELYGQSVWTQLPGLDKPPEAGGPVDLAGVFMAVANTAAPIHIYRVVRPPTLRNQTLSNYTLEFHNCVVASLENGETIEVGTMEVLKTMTVNYTHVTIGGHNSLLKTSSLKGTSVPPGLLFHQ